MDPNLLSMIWWGIPALAGFAMISLAVLFAIVCAVRDKWTDASVVVVLVLAILGNLIAWPCNYQSHRYARMWCGADAEVAEPVQEVR